MIMMIIVIINGDNICIHACIYIYILYIDTLYINSTRLLFWSKDPSANGPGPPRLAALRGSAAPGIYTACVEP